MDNHELPSEELRRVAVLGGGISGMATAFGLARAGIAVTLIESEASLGGLGLSYESPVGRIDRFYHCILPTDRHLLGLLEQLDLMDQVDWKRSGMGFFHRKRRYSLNTPWDLLRFGALPFADRLRMGWGTLVGLRQSRPEALDDITAECWLRKVFGDRCFEVVWRALLQAKFGDAYQEIPALWIWSRLTREKDGGPEVKAMLPGGLKTLINRLEGELVRLGVEIEKKAHVSAVEAVEPGVQLTESGGRVRRFDAAVLAMATRPALKLLGDSEAGRTLSRFELPYQGVVNAVYATREPLDRFYWTAVVDSGVGFQGIVETTQLADPKDFGGHHLVYVMNYVPAEHPLFAQEDSEISERYLTELKSLYPGFGESGVGWSGVFRAPYVEPVYSVGYFGRRPPEVLATDSIYLCNTSQIYPDITSWNSCVGRAEQLVKRIRSEVRAACFPGELMQPAQQRLV